MTSSEPQRDDALRKIQAELTTQVVEVNRLILTVSSSVVVDRDAAIAKAKLALGSAEQLSVHFKELGNHQFDIETTPDTLVAIDVVAERLQIVEAGQGKAPDFSYRAGASIGQLSIEMRSLSYLRVNLAVVYSNVSDQALEIGINDIGGRTLVRGDDGEFTPMLLLTHNWVGADPKAAAHPWDTSRKNWWLNLLPTLALGVPLNQSPLEHLYVGIMEQFVPGLALTVGVHCARVDRIRSNDGFVTGTAAPPVAEFRAQDASRKEIRVGYFVGVVVTDSLFVSVLRPLVE